MYPSRRVGFGLVAGCESVATWQVVRLRLPCRETIMRFDQWLELVCVSLALADVAFGAGLIVWAMAYHRE